jgi:hypothetical protein
MEFYDLIALALSAPALPNEMREFVGGDRWRIPIYFHRDW